MLKYTCSKCGRSMYGWIVQKTLACEYCKEPIKQSEIKETDYDGKG